MRLILLNFRWSLFTRRQILKILEFQLTWVKSKRLRFLNCFWYLAKNSRIAYRRRYFSLKITRLIWILLLMKNSKIIRQTWVIFLVRSRNWKRFLKTIWVEFSWSSCDKNVWSFWIDYNLFNKNFCNKLRYETKKLMWYNVMKKK
jgi:hypothetical protein